MRPGPMTRGHPQSTQMAAPMLAPEVLAEWEERWGSSAHPLLWSHGMFLAALPHFR